MKIVESQLIKVNPFDIKNNFFQIPDGVTSIGAYAFFRCTGLTSVVVSDSVTSIGAYAFFRWGAIKSAVKVKAAFLGGD